MSSFITVVTDSGINSSLTLARRPLNTKQSRVNINAAVWCDVTLIHTDIPLLADISLFSLWLSFSVRVHATGKATLVSHAPCARCRLLCLHVALGLQSRHVTDWCKRAARQCSHSVGCAFTTADIEDYLLPWLAETVFWLMDTESVFFPPV